MNSFLAIDVETTGFSEKYNEIIEVGFSLFENGVSVNSGGFLIKPSQPIPKNITELTGISNDMVEDMGYDKDFVKAKILSKIKEVDTIVMHNAPFDKRFIEAFIGETLNHKTIKDTLKMAREAKLPVENNKLTTLINFFKIDQENAHRAADDAYACGRLYLELIKR